jgi:pimeloyl-ACP methyl ester carboxylesterase
MRELTTRNATVTGFQSGSGDDMVIFHSLLSDSAAFDAVLPRLAARHRVTLVNLPGFHRSRPVAATIGAYVDAVAGAIDEWGVTRNMTLLGNGFGGTLAIEFAAIRPALLSKLIIVDAAAAFPDTGRQAFVTMADTVRTHGMAAIATVAARRVYHDSYIDQHPHVVEERRSVLLGVEPTAFLAACQILASCDLVPRLAGIRTPTLVIFGAKDQATPPALNHIISQHIPDAREHVIEDCGHCPPLENPEMFLSALRGFVAI